MHRLAAFSALLLALSAAAQETIPLRFAPADGTVWKTSEMNSRRVTVGAEPRNDQGLLETTRRIVKTKTGYEVKTVTDANSIKSNGYEIANPMLKANEGVEIDYVIDASGRCTDVRGYDRVLDALRTKLPGPFFQQMAPLFNAAGLKQRDQNGWNARFAALAGKDVSIGETWVERKAAGAPEGSVVPYYLATTVEGWVDCGDEQCLKLRYLADSDAKRLTETLGEGGAAAIDAAAGSALAGRVLDVPLSGEGERIFDPATMRIESEEMVISFQGEADFPSRGKKKFEVVETRKFTSKLGAK